MMNIIYFDCINVKIFKYVYVYVFIWGIYVYICKKKCDVYIFI